MLVGEPGERDTLLSSPIILEDHPRIAPESPGDLFDGGEIDQLLVLNILGLTDEEKAEMRASDPRAARDPRAHARRSRPRSSCACTARSASPVMSGPELLGASSSAPARTRSRSTASSVRRAQPRAPAPARGRRRLRPRARRAHRAWSRASSRTWRATCSWRSSVDDDPGRDLGERRQPGHRFFFAPDEVEPLAGETAPPARRVLVAGIGNVFLGDDGFGVALADRLAPARRCPPGVEVVDYGIRGMDLAYALRRRLGRRGAARRRAARRAAGHAVVIEPDLDGRPASRSTRTAMDPVKVLGAGARARRRACRARSSSAASRWRA